MNTIEKFGIFTGIIGGILGACILPFQYIQFAMEAPTLSWILEVPFLAFSGFIFFASSGLLIGHFFHAVFNGEEIQEIIRISQKSNTIYSISVKGYSGDKMTGDEILHAVKLAYPERFI